MAGEKLAIFIMIIFLCGTILFYIIGFGMLLCPGSDKAWNPTELSQHAGTDDYFAAIRGKVYDVSLVFSPALVSEIILTLSSSPISTNQNMEISKLTLQQARSCCSSAGQDLTNYFPPPMTYACPGLVTNDDLSLMRANFTPLDAYAVHTSGKLQTIPGTRLQDDDWYWNRAAAGFGAVLQRYLRVR